MSERNTESSSTSSLNTDKVISTLRIILINICVTVVSACLIIVCFEITLQHRNSDSIKQDKLLTELIGFHRTPNSIEIHPNGPNSSHPVQFNTWGFRDLPREMDGINTPRIAVLGDSFTEAVQVSAESTFTSQVEKKLNSKVEVLNFGVSGTGTGHSLRLYQEVVRTFSPNAVLLALYYGNDIRNNSLELETTYRNENNLGPANTAGFFRIDPDSELVPVPTIKEQSNQPNSLRHWLSKDSILYLMLRNKWRSIQREQLAKNTAIQDPLAKAKKTKSPPPVSLELYNRLEGEAWQKAWQHTELLLAKIKNEVENDGARFSVMLIPTCYDLDETVWHNKISEYNSTETLDRDYPHTKLMQILDKLKITTIDLRPMMQNEVKEKNVPYLDWDGHFSAYGHLKVAEFLIGKLPLSNQNNTKVH
jgi:hypothetical protein